MTMTLAEPLTGLKGMRLMLLAALALGVIGMQSGRGTLAYFTTAVTSNNNTFKAGNLHFAIDDVNETGQQAVTTSVTNLNMYPGQKTQGPVVLNNTGSLDAKYGV